MLREVLKQMLPFIILMVVLWLVAELLERTMVSGPKVVAPPKTAPRVP